MVGEVTLTGRVLPIGGLKEKTLAARRSGVTTLLFPQGNKKDWDELAGVVTILCLVRNAVQTCEGVLSLCWFAYVFVANLFAVR